MFIFLTVCVCVMACVDARIREKLCKLQRDDCYLNTIRGEQTVRALCTAISTVVGDDPVVRFMVSYRHTHAAPQEIIGYTDMFCPRGRGDDAARTVHIADGALRMHMPGDRHATIYDCLLTVSDALSTARYADMMSTREDVIKWRAYFVACAERYLDRVGAREAMIVACAEFVGWSRRLRAHVAAHDASFVAFPYMGVATDKGMLCGYVHDVLAGIGRAARTCKVVLQVLALKYADDLKLCAICKRGIAQADDVRTRLACDDVRTVLAGGELDSYRRVAKIITTTRTIVYAIRDLIVTVETGLT